MEKGPRRKKRAEKRNETERGQEREWGGKRVKRIEAEIRQISNGTSFRGENCAVYR